ncbi:PucR family transcriptional regulator [Nocardioides jiangxiensis]|uniref:Helix-turn-helix domain-containing protein n=1 Tax=Nocardioides jiangxiensis TaxID=3064524 RepID=A0ABT9AXG4_9ACTN|nr:helix-turn-helix domain-containing protein [Nocardioides sp. WY-20]MDO7867236.1 helix-turn-helix domain-containing protein [Nocardioides sp. WY-20]
MRRDDTVDALVEAFITAESQPAALDTWVERIAGPTLSELPAIAGDAVLADSLQTSVRAHWLAFLAALREPAREVQLVQAAADFAADMALRGRPLTELFQTYRVAQKAVWDYLTTAARAFSGDNRDEAGFLVFVWNRASDWLNASIEASVEIFQDEQDRLRQGAAAQALVTVRGILDGSAGTAADPRELSTALGGYPLSSRHTAVILRAETPERVSELRDAALHLARSVGSRNPLLVSPGGRDLWCWLATSNAPERETLLVAAARFGERGIRSAAGTALPGVDGFRLSHTEAQEAMRISLRSPHTRPITLFADVEILSLISSAGVAADRFVQRTLGELARDTDANARLRETLQALLTTGSVDAAARLLTVHKNTVRYRVAQAEALLGAPLASGRAEVELALRYLDAFGVTR